MSEFKIKDYDQLSFQDFPRWGERVIRKHHVLMTAFLQEVSKCMPPTYRAGVRYTPGDSLHLYWDKCELEVRSLEPQDVFFVQGKQEGQQLWSDHMVNPSSKIFEWLEEHWADPEWFVVKWDGT